MTMRDRPTEKILDMTRSVLPSKSRKGARDNRKAAHRRARRNSRMEIEWLEDLDTADFDDGLYLEYEGTLTDTRQEREDIEDMVRERQSADKLGGFLRWAKANTANIEDDVDKYFHIRSKIGSSTIKDHALGHFIHLPTARDPNVYSRYRWAAPPDNLPWKTEAQLLAWICEAIELDHTGFNRMLRQTDFAIRRPCEDRHYLSCWRDEVVSYDHDDNLCHSKSLVRCIENQRALPSRFEVLDQDQVYLRAGAGLRGLLKDLPCWIPVTRRRHAPSGCPFSRAYVLGVCEAQLVTDYFGGSGFRYDTSGRNTLCSFLRLKGIIL